MAVEQKPNLEAKPAQMTFYDGARLAPAQLFMACMDLGPYLNQARWEDYPAIVEACCQAWNRFLIQPEVVRSVTTRTWAKGNA